jgi:two-component system, NarL family, nitrate/nitrite response regulator NarL
MSLPQPLARPDRQTASRNPYSARTTPLRPVPPPLAAVQPGVDYEDALHHRLTEREIQVLVGMSRGRSNRAIGGELFVAEDTVKTHARRLFRKLGAQDRAHAVHVAWELGILRRTSR